MSTTRVGERSSTGIHRVGRCGVEGCDGVAGMGRAYCLRCEEEIDGLDVWMAAAPHARKGRQARAAKRLERFAWGGLCIAVLYLLLWETRSFWLGLIDMWFGGSQ